MTPYMKYPSLRHKHIYNTTYRGIGIEIQNFGFEPDKYDKWTYYIYLNLNQFTDKTIAKSLWIPLTKTGYKDKKTFSYSSNEFINSLYWHGGCTFYSKLISYDGKQMVKIGCDFSHLWDEGQTYDAQYCFGKVRQTVDELHNRYEYLIFCNGVGILAKESDGKFVDEYFYSNIYSGEIEKRKRQDLISKAIL